MTRQQHVVTIFLRVPKDLRLIFLVIFDDFLATIYSTCPLSCELRFSNNAINKSTVVLSVLHHRSGIDTKIQD